MSTVRASMSALRARLRSALCSVPEPFAHSALFARSALFALCLLCALNSAAGAAEDAGLNARLHALTAHYRGKVTLYATDLRSGKMAALHADVPVPTASVIKLTVLFEALEQIEKGRAHFSDRLTMTHADQVPPSGVLTYFDTPLTVTLKDALTMMVIVSDNTATNLAIDRLGLRNIDRRIHWMGLRNTWLYKKVFKPPVGPQPADQKRFGLGKTTAREMAEVMRRFVTCDLDAPGSATPPSARERALCKAAMFMLENQTDDLAIPRYLGGLTIGNKTGALDTVRNDVAVVYAPRGPVIISEFTYDNADHSWTPDNAAQLLMARLAKTIIDRWR